MDFRKIIAVLEKAAEFVQEAAPLAAGLGPQSAIIGKLAGTAAQFSSEALAHANDAATVISATDLAIIQALAATIQAENDKLAAQIDAG